MECTCILNLRAFLCAGSYHCECTGLWKGIYCSDYVTTSTEAEATSQSTVKFTQQSATTQLLTTHDHREIGSTIFYATDKNDKTTPEFVEQNITEYAHLKVPGAKSTEQTSISLPLQTAQVAKQDTTHTITEMTTTVLYEKDPTNRYTLEDRYLTTTDHPETSSTELLSTHTGRSNYTTADYSPSVTDPVFKEAQRKPSNWTTLELTTGLSLTRLPPDRENEEGGRGNLS
ncbi:hypothetical protein DPMN_160407 [Dreissena polymorpha]|uniref:Uncharacterized protein n=1 Tax=Dreissena polymorpha TaxID=45954 RepID=A0A9D4ER14_DREPO|nr:hypothetical protein DPMN_160407 [Dreissena polymorpha]